MPTLTTLRHPPDMFLLHLRTRTLLKRDGANDCEDEDAQLDTEVRRNLSSLRPPSARDDRPWMIHPNVFVFNFINFWLGSI